MPLANRVDPFGQLFATADRGTMFGNRGGRFHDPVTRVVHGKPWSSRQWICCVLSFKDRRRSVWSKGYTELFFMDEVTALAAGHRPCFECRRSDAVDFAKAWGKAARTSPPKAPEMDLILDMERLEPAPGQPGKRRKRLHHLDCASLPDGTMLVQDRQAFMIRGEQMLRWSSKGYEAAIARATGVVAVLTPPAILGCLTHGYRPRMLAASPA